LMIEGLREALQYFWALIWCHGMHESKLLCQDQAQKLNTKL
jgi:hypothetical protein